MAQIALEKVSKVYPNGFEAVHELDLEAADGEFMVIVGPSGCGKTTALRMVAGLEGISAGTLRIGDRVVNDVSAKDRDIAMVFQNYALYPHMTVGENIGFGLKLRKMSKSEMRERVVSAATMLGLADLIDVKPGQLSGGQRQRVAMGRAIVREPRVFLMDEPLSNLDAKLRVQMRAEIARVQRRLGVATLYVTHDQVEAMTMGDRVAVMRGGLLQQCARPQELYDNPKNLFVAAFIGSPAMNLFEATIGENASEVIIGSQRLQISDDVHAEKLGIRSYANRNVVLGVRPEDLHAEVSVVHAGAGATRQALEGEIELVEALGSELIVHFSIDAKRVEAEGVDDSGAARLSAGALQKAGECIARVEPRLQFTVGSRARFHVDPMRLHFFDPVNGESLAN